MSCKKGPTKKHLKSRKKTVKFCFSIFQFHKSDASSGHRDLHDKSPNLLEVDGGNKKGSRGDTLSTCDSGSEVSDEGYKSSQGGSNSNCVNAGDMMSNSQEKKNNEDDTCNDSVNGKGRFK